MKYIDAEKLIALIDTKLEDLGLSGSVWVGRSVKKKKKNEIITSLQQEQPQVTNTSKMEQEIDLKKEYKKYVEDDPVFSKLTNRNVGLEIARHFWNKGYNARNKK